MVNNIVLLVLFIDRPIKESEEDEALTGAYSENSSAVSFK